MGDSAGCQNCIFPQSQTEQQVLMECRTTQPSTPNKTHTHICRSPSETRASAS